MTQLQKITNKQQEILRLLYRFRFLNRIHIQAFLGHKDPKTINLWLRDLRAKGYIEWIYATDIANISKPAIYYLGLNGVRYLRQLTITDEDGAAQLLYPPEELRKRYKEPSRSRTYIDRCMLIAECCLALKRENTASQVADSRQRYYYQPEAAYLLEHSYYHFILESELIQPSLVFCKDSLDKDGNEEVTLESYLLEVFDPTLPRYHVRKRLSNYMKFLDEEDDTWKERTHTATLPTLLFVCPDPIDLVYVKRRIRKLIADAWEWEDDDPQKPQVRLTTTEKLRRHGLFAHETWVHV